MSSSGNTGDITITRALAELKTVKQRIDKALSSSVFVSYKYRGEEKINITPNSLQKIRDLISYRKRLKAAIVKSNASTYVQIDGESYTVAEAIERKSSIELERTFLKTLKSQLTNVTNKVESHNQQVQRKLDRLLEVEFGKDQVKSNVENMETITESYLKNNRAEIVDPLKLEAVISRMEDSIMHFEKEVDLVLSESNAVTHINVGGATRQRVQVVSE